MTKTPSKEVKEQAATTPQFTKGDDGRGNRQPTTYPSNSILEIIIYVRTQCNKQQNSLSEVCLC